LNKYIPYSNKRTEVVVKCDAKKCDFFVLDVAAMISIFLLFFRALIFYSNEISICFDIAKLYAIILG